VKAALQAAGQPFGLAAEDDALDEHLRRHPLG
jgi:hypothetical protein